MQRTLRVFRAAVLTLATPLCVVFQAAGQDAPAVTTPPAPTYISTKPAPSKVDIYAGYGTFRPVDSTLNGYTYQPINVGADTSVAFFFTPKIGVQAEGTFFPNGPNDCVYTAQAGGIYRMQHNRIVPFVHGLGGGAKVGGPVFQPCTWGWGVTAGGGVDYILPYFHDHLAIRPIQADFHYSQVDYGPIAPSRVSGGNATITAYELSAGLVLRLGIKPPPPVGLACTLQPQTIFPGDPITVTAAATNLDPRKPVSYSWTSTGGVISGTSPTATVATATAQAGTYTVTGHITQGPKPTQSASCSASFTVRAYEPPTISCSANPSTVLSGDPSTITSVARSPQNRGLTYSYTAASGQITGNGTTATLSTVGLGPGPVNIQCTVVDDLGKQATATTSVMVTVPAPQPAPQPVALCGLSFDRDTKRPVRVDNESKACLDDVALALQRDPASKLVIVGNSGTGETPGSAAERALNVRQYLTDEKGIDASRIMLRTGDAGTRSVQNSLLPPGATFDTGTAVDPDSVQRHGQAYGKPKPAKKPRTRRKKAATTTAAQ